MQKEFAIEQKYLKETKKIIDSLIETNNQSFFACKSELDECNKDILNKPAGDEVLKFLYDKQTKLENIINNLSNDNYKLKKIKYSPYFGKIDIKDEFENNVYYIGTKNIMQKSNLVVLDWRAPICSLFYDAKIGKTSYIAPNGKIEVELINKRQFKIENGQLIKFYDISNEFCDDMLLESLSNTTSAYMKNIVSTLQQEQNQIIREDTNTSVIVNGIAGSGKTSIGMHRIAYLLFQNRENLNKDNFLIISPNELFTEYISHLLPELGEDNVGSTSVVGIFNRQIDKLGRGQDKQQLIHAILSGQKIRYKESKFKYTLEFLEKLKQFLCKYNAPSRLKKDILIEEYVVTKKMLQDNYFKPNQENIALSITATSENIVDKFFYMLPKIKQNKILKAINHHFYNDIFTKNILSLYKEFLETLNFSTDIKHNGLIKYEDLPAIVYIKGNLCGFDANYTIKQIFLDEMQDYDAMTLYLLKQIYPKANFTMVGDFEQNLLFEKDNKLALELFYSNSKCYNLTTNYRSTCNISKFACKIIDKEYSSNFTRMGVEPEIILTKSIQETQKQINEQLNLLQQKGYQRIAIICKTDEDVKKYKKYLPNCVTLSNDTNKINLDKPILTNIYYSKGLEFDAVILLDVNRQNYHSQVDRRLLYVACTRALHELIIFSNGDLSPLVDS